MQFLHRFRRYLLLLLSLTLSVQAMAVASLGACHQVKALALASANIASANIASVHDHHADQPAHRAAEHRHGHSHSHSEQAAHVALNTDADERPAEDDGRVKCPACATCHLCSVLLTTPTVLADVPAGGSVSFVESTVPRVRNVASGLERPPRA